MTYRAAPEEIDVGGPVVAAILEDRTAEDVLATAFAQARDREVPLRVLIAGAAASGDSAAVRAAIERWAGRYPDVTCSVSARAGLDAAITVAAGARRCGLVVAGPPAGARDASVLRALRHRVRCPLTVTSCRVKK
ncbi:hypothetical protein [Paractinoplanes atraurantiacus]|uniref:Universal stress protein family protein n=1 Tax=Paractinoplanes atraurantiacus TaxID=1036182 RepID=A0A285JJ57_9ACTN|nr:hypothetical protein [Actinoplanes atraurantiacus]SNY59131.1 hypothetical protein SAMN05421748_12050 [Actinoplanes atraurantiacus]